MGYSFSFLNTRGRTSPGGAKNVYFHCLHKKKKIETYKGIDRPK